MDSTPKRTKQYLATSDSEEVSDVELEFDEVREQEEHMKCHMSYGDVGWNAYGKTGLYLVNFFIGVTQFGFCVGYFIFIGNTLHRLFPVEPCDNLLRLSNFTSHDYPFCHVAKGINTPVNQSDLFLKHNRDIRDLTSKDLVDDRNSSDFTTLPPFMNDSTTMETTTSENVTTTLTSTTHNTSTTTIPSTTTAANASQISSIVEQSTAPSLKLLVASPLPIFIIFAMIRTIRKMSFISVLANLSIFLGCIAVFIFLIIGE